MTSNEQQPKRRPGSYRNLLVWQKGMPLASHTYRLTHSFPEIERFGLISQMRRAAVSVLSNIAEGQARNSTAEFVRFISNAEGSLAELGTQMQLSLDLGFIKQQQVEEALQLLSELKKMLNALRRSLLK